MVGDVPGGETELLGLTVGTGDGVVTGVPDGDGRAVGFGFLVGAGVGVGDGEAGEPGGVPDVLLASVGGGLTLA